MVSTARDAHALGDYKNKTGGKKKTVQLALSQDVGPCTVILFKLGSGTFNLTQ